MNFNFKESYCPICEKISETEINENQYFCIDCNGKIAYPECIDKMSYDLIHGNDEKSNVPFYILITLFLYLSFLAYYLLTIFSIT